MASRIRTLCVLSATVLSLTIAGQDSASKQAHEHRLRELAWLTGSWSSTDARGHSSEEHWTTPRNGLMLGTHRDLRGKRASFEFLRIVQRGKTLVYIASPSGGKPTEFALESLERQRAVFANPEHDWPKRLIYERKKKTLHVTAEGKTARDMRRLQWTWRRTTIEASPAPSNAGAKTGAKTGASAPGPGPMTAERFVARSARFAVRYVLYLPPGYHQDKNRRWPLMLFLHGAGERGQKLSMVRRHGPPKLAAQERFPFVVIAPQCPKGRAWRRAELVALLDHVEANLRIDQERVYVSGLSMGGYGTWALGLAHPDRFAAIVPICGGGETLTARMLTRQKKAALRSLGIWAFHGKDDRVVRPSESERMVDAVRRLGATPKFTLYEGVGHNSWTRAYQDPALYEWLAKQRRTGRSR